MKGGITLNNDLTVTTDYIKAKDLDRRIKTSAHLAQQSLYDMCMGFKEMRDSKLYKELGYQNFEEYCERETGFTRMNVYRYISIVEKLPRDFVTSMLQIGMTKLTLLTTIPEETRTEIVETTDLEKTSVKELKAKLAELQETNKKLEDDKTSAKERQDKLLKKNLQLVEEIDSFKDEKAKTEEKVQCLENQIKELENKPHDCYEDTTKIDELTATLNEEREKHKAELENLKSKEVGTNTNASEKNIEGQFRAYTISAVDAMSRLTAFVEENSESFSQYNSFFLEKLERIVTLTNRTINKLR
mgnify:CR=1 FL=1